MRQQADNRLPWRRHLPWRSLEWGRPVSKSSPKTAKVINNYNIQSADIWSEEWMIQTDLWTGVKHLGVILPALNRCQLLQVVSRRKHRTFSCGKQTRMVGGAAFSLQHAFMRTNLIWWSLADPHCPHPSGCFLGAIPAWTATGRSSSSGCLIWSSWKNIRFL